MSVVIGKKYVIYSEKLRLKYFITATSWNIDILTYLADTPYKDRDHLSPFEDWTLGEEYDNKRRSGLLHELPLWQLKKLLKLMTCYMAAAAAAEKNPQNVK